MFSHIVYLNKLFSFVCESDENGYEVMKAKERSGVSGKKKKSEKDGERERERERDRQRERVRDREKRRHGEMKESVFV